MKVLVINCGSSSLKYQLIDMDNESVICKGTFERIGDNAFLKHKINGNEYKFDQNVANHKEALEFVFEQLQDKDHPALESLDEISAIGHRVVHGGEKFASSVLINDEVIDAIDQCSSLAPAHNPNALIGIKACQDLVPGKPMVAVFDTAFHQTISKEKYICSVPYEYYTKYGLRKYGFHGTSHKYVSERISTLLHRNDLKIVNCHLGQGASICAIKEGKSVETSMGLTPTSGIPMCARSGDLDPAIVTFLMDKENLSTKEVNTLLNKKSGLLGISNVSNDFRDIYDAKIKGNELAKLAIDHYAYKVATFIASYMVSLNGLDVITFTAGIGENRPDLRKQICENLSYLGIKINDEKNDLGNEEMKISTEDSKVEVWVVPTNEELMIARDTLSLII